MRIPVTQIWPVNGTFYYLLSLDLVPRYYQPHVEESQKYAHTRHANGKAHAWQIPRSRLRCEDEADRGTGAVTNQLNASCGACALEVSRMVASRPDEVE